MTAQHTFAQVHIDRFDGVDEVAGVAKNDPILVSESITRRFGGLTAVSVGHCEIERGAITALIGPNGAGKTTFFNLLTGFDKPNSGTWSFDGIPLDGLTSYRIARLGMVRTFQLTKALARLSVTCATTSPASCRAASASSSRWRERSWPSLSSSCSTSRWRA